MNELIYGKNSAKNIVSIEPGESTVEIFYEEDGQVRSQVGPISHFILFHEQHNPKMKRLAGNQYYRYMIEYDSYTKFQEVLSACYKKKYPLQVVRDPKEAVMIKDGLTYFKGTKVQDVSVLSFDIETTGLVYDDTSRVLLISNTFRCNGTVTRRLFSVDEYADQVEMI